MRPEMPYLAAGGVSLIGGAVAAKGWPKQSLTAVIATIVLVIVASATSETRIAPLVRAIGLLLFLVAGMAATKQIAAAKKKAK